MDIEYRYVQDKHKSADHRTGLFLVAALLFAPYSIGADVNEDPMYREAIEKFNQSDWEGAHRLFKSLQESYPDEPVILNNLAVIAVQQNQPELAVRLLEHAILSHPTAFRELQKLASFI